MRARWSYSLVLLVGYLGVFHLWNVLPRAGILISTAVALAVLGALFVRAARRGYFTNRWDALGHAVILVDIAAEGFAVSWHSGHSFYLCALAFGLVVGGYRALKLGLFANRAAMARGSSN